ncbi:MAG: LysR family transcriptional regulator [Deltaproteobacteria bacterium]|nr:LysR family transcriptional regulator [Deltaproteobacteria bacterium]
MRKTTARKSAGAGKTLQTKPERSPEYKVEGHIWIDGGEGDFLGVGRVTLLEMIRETGSITKAARAIKMSYRRAWEHVESMNRQSASPLVTASVGGRGGGGASLTEAGESAIKAFRGLDERFRAFREREQGRIRITGC